MRFPDRTVRDFEIYEVCNRPVAAHLYYLAIYKSDFINSSMMGAKQQVSKHGIP
jgi:hypothetical protein